MDIYHHKVERQREIFSGVGAMPHTFIQWKGTDVCLDFHCKCGAHLHFDCDFLYGVHCEHCDRVYMMGDRVPAFDVTGTEYEAEVRENETTQSGFDDDLDPEKAKRQAEAAAEWAGLVARIQAGSMVVTSVSTPEPVDPASRVYTGVSFTIGPKPGGKIKTMTAGELAARADGQAEVVAAIQDAILGASLSCDESLGRVTQALARFVAR